MKPDNNNRFDSHDTCDTAEPLAYRSAEVEALRSAVQSLQAAVDELQITVRAQARELAKSSREKKALVVERDALMDKIVELEKPARSRK